MNTAICLLTFHLILSKLQVLSPPDLTQLINSQSKNPLTNNGTIDYSTSLFGNILYDEQFVVNLVGPNDSLSQKGCNPLPVPTLPNNQLFVWIVERGNCSFTTKAHNAQLTGAFAVLLVDDVPNEDMSSVIALNDNACALISYFC